MDLKGWTITNIKEGVEDWSLVLDSSHVLPNGYSLLFFDEGETSSATAKRVQSNYVGSVGEKLTADAGMVIFSNNDEQIAIPYPQQYPHLSYCEDGFMVPTPGKENGGLVTSISNRVVSPTFSGSKPGLYESNISVELSCATDGAQIYYTLNGDIPTIENW